MTAAAHGETQRSMDAQIKRVYRAHATDEEIADVLAQRLVATVGTTNPDGSVHMANVIFLHSDGLFYIETSSITRKARNAERTGLASLLVQGTAATGRTLMVSIEGSARLVRGDEADAINYRVRSKYVTPEALADMDRAFGRLDDVAVEITPRVWRSWQGSALQAFAQKELSVPYEHAWIADE